MRTLINKSAPGLILILLCCLGCSKFSAHDEDSKFEVSVDEIPEDIRIPAKLWDEIEGVGVDAHGAPNGHEAPKEAEHKEASGGHGDGKEGAGGQGISAKKPILFSPLTIIITANNAGVLLHHEIRIAFPRGGGQIDLSKWVTGETGSFFVRFEWPEWAEAKDIKSYFVSRAKMRKLDGEVYGSGCNKYLDLTGGLSRENSKNGLKVNVTRARHSTVLGGHFIFSAQKDNQIFLTQVTFVDSSNTNLFCDKKAGAEKTL